jgi:GNAT superfamily N-acetyltransferase
MTTAEEKTPDSPVEQKIHLLLRALHTYLPYSLPLYRRLQFHLSHPNPPFAQVFDAFTPLSPLSKERLSPEQWLSLASKQESPAGQTPWICSHIDLSAAGQTQVWVFANWELPETQTQTATAQDLEARRQLLQTLFEKIYDRDVSSIPSTGPKGWLKVKKLGREDIPFSRTRVLFGALNLCVRSLIPQGSGERLDDGTLHYLFLGAEVITRVDEPYKKYLFPTTRSSHRPLDEQNGTESSVCLPPDYRFGPMPYQYLQMVLDRTSIPRGLDTMASFFSIGLFYNQDPSPIGWGFLGKDASLTSLHTEPEHRGKGLAVLLSKELFRQQNEHFRTLGDEETAQTEVLWAHADVSENNMASRKVMEKIGGKVEWQTCWIEVELESLVGEHGMWRTLGKE